MVFKPEKELQLGIEALRDFEADERVDAVFEDRHPHEVAEIEAVEEFFDVRHPHPIVSEYEYQPRTRVLWPRK